MTKQFGGEETAKFSIKLEFFVVLESKSRIESINLG